jgi:DNA-binding response OmpR family regulator
MPVILLIDEDPLEARLIVDHLMLSDHVPLWAGESWDGLVMYRRVRPDLIIMAAPTPKALEWLQMLRLMRGTSTTPVLLIADRCPSQYYLAKLDVADCLVKPVDTEVLLQQVHNVLRQSAFNRRLQVPQARVCTTELRETPEQQEHPNGFSVPLS